MCRRRIFVCLVFVAVWQCASPASLQLPLPVRLALAEEAAAEAAAALRAEVREAPPPPLCAVRCAMPPDGPVCAFDAAGTARTFATLCELEHVSCRESTYYAITSLGEC